MLRDQWKYRDAGCQIHGDGTRNKTGARSKEVLPRRAGCRHRPLGDLPECLSQEIADRIAGLALCTAVRLYTSALLAGLFTTFFLWIYGFDSYRAAFYESVDLSRGPMVYRISSICEDDCGRKLANSL
jgi:hypothetical protein